MGGAWPTSQAACFYYYYYYYYLLLLTSVMKVLRKGLGEGIDIGFYGRHVDLV